MPLNIIKAMMLMLILPVAFTLPYGYYSLLRIVATIFFIISANLMDKKKDATFFYVFGILAIIFNPIIKIHFSKNIWALIDLISAIIIGLNIDKLEEKNVPHNNE